MTAFVLRHASHANAVSSSTRETATETWEDVAGHPITAITNGVHVATWLGRPMRRPLRARHGHLRWPRPRPGRAQLARVGEIDDAELWAAHSSRSGSWSASSRAAWPPVRPPRRVARPLREVRGALDPKALTIGFARRFATYKRADLLFRDEERLARHPRRSASARCRSSSPARRTRPTGPDSRSSSASSSCRAPTGCAAGSSSSRTTTSASPASWSAASTSGSTTRGARWRRPARPA